ncbi:DUF4407 domain-containing protein [Nocardia australiensis]|uniref:DUF4407 domain-containing protein n=1 Tax=Nocardia australiensis TaxID=2887191 RepID=UPI001D150357|nr:DUF4407 domain-containing protein [Nocardia australiensis]
MTVTGVFARLGGGLEREPHETAPGHERASHERTSYALTGAVVLSFAVVSGAITALASAGTWSLLAVIAATLIVALVAGAIARALATRRTAVGSDRVGMLARFAVAVLAGGLIAELAAVVLFGGTVDRLVDESAQRSVASAPAVVAANGVLDADRANRAALDQSITKARNDIDQSLVTARCEFNPTPGCPQTRITGVPGRGPESQTANEMLEDARNQLAAAQERASALDQRITDDQKAVRAAESTAFTDADRGLGARWQAMNDYTSHNAGALALRVLTIVAMIFLALLPLILRWWRGETFLDRRIAADMVADHAERSADAAIAAKRAEVRAEAETLRAEQQLTVARLAIEADTAVDRERQRTRIIAAVGGLELGITEPPRRELPAASAGDRRYSSVSKEPNVTPNLPTGVNAGALAPASSTGQLTPAADTAKGGLELPLIGTVPFSDTAARFILPLVPSFVANAIDTATHPLRTARQAFEEVEEITFTLRRTRKVTVDSQDSHAPAMGAVPGEHQLPPGVPQWQAQHIAAGVVDADYSAPHVPRYSALPSARSGYSLPARHNGELPARRNPELPGNSRRELPPGR